MPPPNLDLPKTAPRKPFWMDNLDEFDPALYTLVKLSGGGGENGGIKALVKALENDESTLRDTYHLGARYDFSSGGSLKDIFDHHLQITKDKATMKCHPCFFVVVHQEDYKKDGVLIVNLDKGYDGLVEKCHIEVGLALSAIVNIKIANMDWEDFTEREFGSPW